MSAILLLGLGLLWSVEPASAQQIKKYQLTVRIHAELDNPSLESKIQDILSDASDLLQGKGSISSGMNRPNHCEVGFELKHPITSFTSAPAEIIDETSLEAVHSVPANDTVPNVPADVKVVRRIKFCLQGEGLYYGCAWRPPGPGGRPKQRTVIISLDGIEAGVGPLALAHEFGHTTGLLHLYQKDNLNLMTPCTIEAFNKEVNQRQCDHFRIGPVRRYPPGSGPDCPKSESGQNRAD